MGLFAELEWRGLVYDATEGAREALDRGKLTGYIGFDPTGASLHVGSLLQIIALVHLQRHGHSPVALVGGGTGLIGDPSGKTVERQLLTADEVEANVEGIRRQLATFLDFDDRTAAARLVNNAEWLTRLGAIEFMRDVGKHFTVNAMLAKESVRRRVEGEEGISYTEFSYSLLQAYDYLELFDRHGCTLQMGGSDQWGNITAGMELIRRVRGGRAHGLVLPLIQTASGAKFGKTEAGTAIWLDPVRTTPFQFYQFWLQIEDRDVVRYLKFFTFFDAARIADLERSVVEAPETREAQRALARDVTARVHGAARLADAEAAARALFASDIGALTARQVEQTLVGVPTATIPPSALGWPVIDLLATSGVTKSKGEAARLIRGGGVYINDRRITDEKARVTVEQAIEGRLFVVRKGKRDNYLVHIR